MSELDKWAESGDERFIIISFLDWLERQRMEIAVPRTEGRWALVPINETRMTLLYRYFKIDPTKLENERRSLLKRSSATESCNSEKK